MREREKNINNTKKQHKSSRNPNAIVYFEFHTELSNKMEMYDLVIIQLGKRRFSSFDEKKIIRTANR